MNGSDRPDRAPSDHRPAGLSWRDPVLWLVIGPPAAAVVAGLFTVWIAASHRDPLVSDTVRKVGVSWQDTAAPSPAAASAPAVAPAPASKDDAAGRDGDGG